MKNKRTYFYKLYIFYDFMIFDGYSNMDIVI